MGSYTDSYYFFWRLLISRIVNNVERRNYYCYYYCPYNLKLTKSIILITLFLITSLTGLPRDDVTKNVRPPFGSSSCQHKVTGELGVCMFALDCVKVNGTHGGLCIDGFYFGSCCLKMASLNNNNNNKNNTTDPAPSQTENVTEFSKLTPNNNGSSVMTNGSKVDLLNSNQTSPPPITLSPLLFAILYSTPITSRPADDDENKIVQKEPPFTLLMNDQNSTVSLNTSVDNDPLVIESNESEPHLTPSHGHWNETGLWSEEVKFFSSNGTLLVNDYKQICGRTFLSRTARIVGGNESSYGKWPWQISFRVRSNSTFNHTCGAVLLNENYALTAAHCLARKTPENFLLRLGAFDQNGDQTPPYRTMDRLVKMVAIHARYDKLTFEYDLALLKFNEPVPFQPNIIPICMQGPEDTNLVGKTAYATGWGKLSIAGPLPSKLHEIGLPLISNEECEARFKVSKEIQDIPKIFLCAGGGREGGRDACDGDSGGPLVFQQENSRWILIGITSWGIDCAKPNRPGVYIRMSEVRNWVNQMLQF